MSWAAVAQTATTLRCFYDDLGQLTKVIDSNGNEIDYVYDAVGNLLQIARPSPPPPNSLAIFNFTPQQGGVGANVTIQGQNFAAVSGSNTVTFNGTPATVLSATSTTLVVTVPLGASTGAISVTVGGSTVQSSTFLVVPAMFVTPANPSVPLGNTVKFTAMETLGDGSSKDVTAAATWSSEISSIAAVSNAQGSAGLATTLATGITSITATVGSTSGSSTLTVNPAILVSLAVTPSNPSFAQATTVQFNATGTFSDGSTRDETTAVTWTSSNPGVATVGSGTGIVTTVAPGTTTIGAAQGSVSSSTILTVTQAGPPSGSVPRFAFVTNGVHNISISAVDPATGQLRALGYLNTNLTLSSSGSASAIHPSGQFAYFVAQGGLIGFSINPNNGALTALPGSPFSTGVFSLSSVTVDPTGKFVFGTADRDNRVFSYVVGSDGALTAALGSPFSGGQSPGRVTVDPLGKFAYVPDGNADAISVFAIDPSNGALTPIDGSPFATGAGPVSAAIDKSGKFLYVANLGSNNVSAYTIDSTSGSLTPINGAPFTAGTLPEWVTAEPSGKFLYVLNDGSSPGHVGSISAYAIDGITGSLTPVGQSQFPVGSAPISMTADPSGRFVYVANGTPSSTPLSCCLNLLIMYTIDPTSGALTTPRTFGLRAPTAIGITSGSAALKFSPKFAYIANNGDNTISASAIDPATGALSPVPSSPFAAGIGTASVTADPAGQFVYAANATAGTVSAYTADAATGALLPISGSPFAAGSGPAAATVDPSGRFVYVANQNSNNVSAYSIVAGSLSPVLNSPFPADHGPVFTQVDPNGQFSYVANQGSNDVTSFIIDPVAGGLSRGGAQPTGLAPVSVAADPTGNFVYIANSASDNLSAYVMVDQLGGLSEIRGSPFAAGKSPSALVVDVSGKFLFATNAGTNNVSAYSIDATTGALTPLTDSPFPAGTTPSSVSVDSSGQFLYVVNAGSNDVSVFSIDPITGSLTEILGSPFPAGTKPVSIRTTGTSQ
jgi:6-phosphogluconolactonase